MAVGSARSGERTIVPFWNRVPLFFLFPLHLPMIWRVALFSAVAALGIYATSFQAIAIAIGGLSLVAWIGFLRFGSRVLSETSFGHLAPHQYSQFSDETLAYMPFKIFILFLASAIAVALLGGLFGPTVAIGANLLVSLMMPAALIVLVVSRSLFAGLNPAASFSVMGAIGKPYLLLCVFLFSLSTAQGFLSAQLIQAAVRGLVERWTELQVAAREVKTQADAEAIREMYAAFNAEMLRLKPRFAATLFLINVVAMYFTLIAFNMLGYAAYQYHEKLGLEVDDETAPSGRGGAQPEADPEAKRIAELVAAGQIDQALEIAYEAQRLDAEDVPAHERYHKLLMIANKDDRLLAHTNRLIPMLLRLGKPGNALEVLRRTREKLPQYRPEQAEHVFAVAEAARAGRDAKLAFGLLDGFELKYPRSALLPEVMFLQARILCEDLRDDARADALFAGLCTQFANHPRAVEAQRFREVLARMAAIGTVTAGPGAVGGA